MRLRALRKYVTLTRLVARSSLAHRLSFVLGLFGLLFQLLAMLAIWRAMLGAGATRGFSYPDMKAYLLVSFGTGLLMSTVGDWMMGGRIHSGDVALDLMKPIDYQGARFAEVLGMVGLELFAAAVVWAGVIAVTGPIAWPVMPALFVLSVVLVVPTKFALVYLTTLLCFWTQNYLGIMWARDSITRLFSGGLVPLAYFPGWFQATAAVLPLAGITSSPALIYLGKVDGATALQLIGVQVVWIVVLVGAGRLAWRSALRQLTVHGG